MKEFNFENFVRGMAIWSAVTAFHYSTHFPDVDLAEADLNILMAKCAMSDYGRVPAKYKPDLRCHWGACI